MVNSKKHMRIRSGKRDIHSPGMTGESNNCMPDGRIRQNIRSGITVSIVLKQDPANRKTDPRNRQGHFDELRFSPTWDQGTAGRWTGLGAYRKSRYGWSMDRVGRVQKIKEEYATQG
jgi:hypothetical protein